MAQSMGDMNAKLIRKGKVGDWKNYFTDEN